MRYKDFPKHDFRRCLSVLVTIEDLQARATLHYIAQALACTRAEVSRAIALAQQQFAARIEKTGPVYQLLSWGIIDRVKARTALDAGHASDDAWRFLDVERPCWSRESEARLVESLANAVSMRRTPSTRREADVYRLSAQLLKTRHRGAADFLDSAARQFYFSTDSAPSPFPRMVSDGVVSDVPRLRKLLEKRLEGIRSW